ncbi:unnamed protein product [Prunus brigantina]
MLIPEMGYLIANCYNVVLMHFSNTISLMFLPMQSHPLPEYQRREISIELFEKHFMQIHLQPHHPMPHVNKCWLDISNLKAFDCSFIFIQPTGFVNFYEVLNMKYPLLKESSPVNLHVSALRFKPYHTPLCLIS